jgi:hypothetical protein
MGLMRDILAAIRLRTAVLSLESAAMGAGCAMACPFGSSAELEEAAILRKLRAGGYARQRRRRYVLGAAAAGSVLTAFVWLI